jgi:hypothetical protein
MQFREYSENAIRGIFGDARKAGVKLAFCFPGPRWGIDFCTSWDRVQSACLKNDFPFTVSRAYEANIYSVRNKCLGGDWKGPEDQKVFGGAGITHTLWIDSDTVFPLSCFLTMLGNFELDIVTGLVKTRENEGYAVYTMDNYDEKAQRFKPWTGSVDPEDGYPFEVEHTGMAFTMIKTEAFHAVGYPWFRPVFGKVVTGPLATDYRDEAFTEDTGFMSLAKQKGYRVWADPRILCGHIKERVLW